METNKENTLSLEELWQNPSPIGSDSITVVFNRYLDSTDPAYKPLRLTRVTINTPEPLVYALRSENIRALRAAFINGRRSTITIAFQNMNKDDKFATFRIDKNKASIQFGS